MANPQVQRCIQEGMTHHQAERGAEAFQCYARARAMDPASWEAHQYGGMAALMLGRSAEAVQLFSRALSLNPKSAPSAVALGLTQLATGDAPAAEATLRLAVKLDARSSEAWDNLGLILRSRGALDEALRCHAEAVKTGPKNVMAWVNQGVTLLGTPRVWEALASFERALRLDKKNESAQGGRAICLYRSHRTAEAAAEFAALFARNPSQFHLGSYLLMALNNLDTVAREELWRSHQAYGRAVGQPLRRMSPRVLAPGERLRVAFLSCDLKGHSVTYFLKPLVRGAAAAGVDLLLYHDHGTEDATSAELRGLASLWRNLSGQLDAVVEKRILEDAPDVLVDLAGHTGSNRLAMLAHRLAPMQVSYLGYPNTTGVPAMDFRFVDGVTDPEGEADVFHSERLMRFSPCAWAYEPPVDAPECREGPAEPGKGPVLGCFNHASKINDMMMRAWGRILAAMPTARLLLKSPGLDHPEVRDPFVARLRAAGVDLRRTEILGTTDTVAQHLALYRRVDLALDTTPYNGTTTTCEALWMGVPVLTLAGDRHAARVSLSLLRAVGCEDWVVYSIDDYIARAQSLAGALVPGAQGTSEQVQPCNGKALRERMRASILLDHEGQAARFWTALKACWEGRRAGVESQSP